MADKMKGMIFKKRLAAAVLTGALAVGMMPAAVFAEGALVSDSTKADADPAGPAYSLAVGGLENGDTVKYYKIVEQDVDTADDEGNTVVGTQQWKLTSAVDKDGNGIVDGTESTDFGHKTPGPDGMIGTADDVAVKGLYVDELVIVDYTTADKDGIDTVTSDTRQLTPAMVNAISSAVTNNGAAAAGTDLTAADQKVEVPDLTSGMYMFIAVPGTANTKFIYKPVFVSCDYYNSVSTPEDNTHAITLVPAGETDATDYRTAASADANAGIFKKSPLSIDKKSGLYNEDGSPVDTQQDVAVGDTVNFSITVPIPTYTKNYVSPMFYITDTLTEGLALKEDTIAVTVKNGSDTVDVTKDKDYRIFTKQAGTVAPKAGEDVTDYYDFKNTLAESSTMHGFVVQFLNSAYEDGGETKDGFLYRVVGAPTCTITYQATVTETDKQKFAQQITQMDNTAKLNYSKDPNYIPEGYFKTDDEGNKTPDPDYDSDKPDTKDEEGGEEPTGELQDKTRHYTFDIDADVLGRDQSGDKKTDEGGNPTEEPLEEEEHDRTSEIRKTWLDANGKVIQTKTSELVKKGGTEENGVHDEDESTTDYGWLEGAEFTLTKTYDHVTTFTGADGQDGTEEFKEIVDDSGTASPVEMKFDADSHIRVTTGGENPKSDGKGYIAMKGLDAGIYILKEIKAPLGYAFNPNVQYKITITPKYVFEAADAADGSLPQNGTGGADDLILDSYTVTIVTQKLDDKLNVVGEEEVTTISTYNVKKDDGGNPISLLKDDGSSNADPASDPAGTGGIDVTVESFGNNETALVVNKRLGMLPATGGSGLYYYLGLGAAVILLFGFLIRKVRKASSVG